MPYWKVDKFVRKLVGPNPFRAHDAIGTKGSTFLTWSCLHHLSGIYGEVFTPTPEQIKKAKAVVAAFAAQPGAGAVGIDGKMYDRPHLVLAQALLERVKT